MSVPVDTVSSLRPLFQRGQIGKLELSNRFVQSGLYTLFATAWGEAGDKIVEYFRERARGGVGLIITENTTIDWALGRAAGNPLRIDHDRFRAPLRDLTEAVHNEGGKIALQLHHSGRQNSAGNTDTGEPPIAPTGGITSAFGSPPREIRLDEIPQLIEQFANGARRAVDAGFDAVELHGAHGYLLGQFLSPKTNKRNDAYGGPLANRARFALEVVTAIRKVVGPDFPLIYRLSVEEPYEGGLPLADGLAFAEMVEPLIDALHVSAGNYDTVRVMTSMGPPGELLHYALAVRAKVNIPVIAVGRMNWMMTEAAKAVEAGKIDFIAMGRGLLADPALVGKARAGRFETIRQCIACSECAAAFLFRGLRTQCVINPELGQELKARGVRQSIQAKKRVLVVGAGPAGMQAAIIAAQRGHAVTLMDRLARVGGLLNAWARPQARRAEILRLVDYYDVTMKESAISRRLGEEADASVFENFDVVLLATGTQPPDEYKGADAADMMLANTLPSAGEVVVYGRVETALYASLWLAESGKKVELHSPVADIGVDSNDMLRGHLSELLAAKGVAIKTNVPKPSSTNAVIWSEPRLSSTTFADLVGDQKIFSIGTRLRGGRLYEATQNGYWTAARL